MGESIEGVVEVRTWGDSDRPTDLLVEIPHGATAAEYRALEAHLTSTLPPDLIEFFHVNTDSGAAEVAEALATLLAGPGCRVDVIRCRLPRTFIDCNRVLDQDPAAYRSGGVTPGVPPWITTEADHQRLRAAYAAYQRVVTASIDHLPPHARLLLLHTYAPRTLDVEVNLDIVTCLRRAYETPEAWPLRPEVDLIARDPEGVRLLSEADVSDLRAALAAIDLPLAENATYALHPVTTAWGHTQRLGGRAACLEVRRDLLGTFVPLRPVQVDAARVRPIAGALAAWLAPRIGCPPEPR